MLSNGLSILRREFWKLLFGIAGATSPVTARAGEDAGMAAQVARARQDYEQAAREFYRKALELFPFELVETSGREALAKWGELKTIGRGIPVVFGEGDGNGSLGNLLNPFGPKRPGEPPLRSVEDIARAAASIRFPTDLAHSKKAEEEEAARSLERELAAKSDTQLPNMVVGTGDQTRTLDRSEVLAALLDERRDPPIGKWPARPHPSMGLSVARSLHTDEPLPKVFIGLAQTDDWTLIPAILRWGGWNSCPHPEYHVAALRAWRDRYGAELVGMSFDTINLRVARRPSTREEALALAREQYVYCPDLIDQGVGTYSALAADLMANDWWYFWWD